MNTKMLLPAALFAALIPSLATAQRADAPRFQRPDPETLAAEMIGDYDADETDSLTEAELVAAFQGVRGKRRAEMATLCPCPMGGKGGPGMRGGRGRGGPPDAEFMAEMLFKISDENKDGALDSEELVAGLTWMRAHRAGRGGFAPPPPPLDVE